MCFCNTDVSASFKHICKFVHLRRKFVLSCSHCFLRFDWHSLNNVISLHSVLRWFIATRVGNNCHQLQSQQTNNRRTVMDGNNWLCLFSCNSHKISLHYILQVGGIEVQTDCCIKICKKQIQTGKVKGNDLRTFYGLWSSLEAKVSQWRSEAVNLKHARTQWRELNESPELMNLLWLYMYVTLSCSLQSIKTTLDNWFLCQTISFLLVSYFTSSVATAHSNCAAS